MKNPTATLSVPHNGARLHVCIYSPDSAPDAPGTPYGVSLRRPPLLVLHGNGGSQQEFEHYIEVFSQKRTVIALDSRGHGGSPNFSGALSYELMAHDMCEVLDMLGIPEVHVMGFSDGAIIGFILAFTKPYRIKTLSALGGNVTPDGLNQTTQNEIRSAYDKTDSTSEKQLLELMLTQPQISAADLQRIICPTQLVVGEFDMIAPEHTAFIAQQIPTCSLEIITGADHFALLTHPHEMTDLIDQFMRDNEKELTLLEPHVAEDIEIRLLELNELKLVYDLYDEVVDSLDMRPNYSGWKRDVYPTHKVAHHGVMSQSLYGAFSKETGQLVGSVILQFGFDEPFNVCGWEQLQPHEILAIKTLVARPSYHRGKVAQSLIAFAQQFAGQHEGCKALRLNTAGQNVPANYIYTRLGFKRYYATLMPYEGLDMSHWTNVYEKRL